MAGALDGIKALDLTLAYAGPLYVLLLRDPGAEIIKVARTVKDGGEEHDIAGAPAQLAHDGVIS